MVNILLEFLKNVFETTRKNMNAFKSEPFYFKQIMETFQMDFSISVVIYLNPGMEEMSLLKHKI